MCLCRENFNKIVARLTRNQGLGSVNDVKESVKIRFPNVFSGLGKLGSPYQIKLKVGAKPFCLASLR